MRRTSRDEEAPKADGYVRLVEEDEEMGMAPTGPSSTPSKPPPNIKDLFKLLSLEVLLRYAYAVLCCPVLY